MRADGLSFYEAILEGVFTVPGAGDVDFHAVLAHLDNGGYSGWLIVEAEQDPARHHPLEEALLARRYLRDLTGR